MPIGQVLQRKLLCGLSALAQRSQLHIRTYTMCNVVLLEVRPITVAQARTNMREARLPVLMIDS